MGQAQVESAPGVHKMLFRAGGSGLPGSLSHQVPIGRALVKNALQPFSDPGSRGLSQKPVVSVYQEIFYTVEMGNDNRKPGRRSLVGNQGKRFVEGRKHENVGAPEV